MKKKSTAISSPKVIPPKRNLQQPNNLARTEPHDVGGLLASLREVIKTASASYGKRFLADLENLNAKFGKGFDDRNLRHIRTFHITFPNWNALRSELSWTQTSYLRKSAQSVDDFSHDNPRVSASSAQSVFYRNPSAFICVHLRLISVSLSDRTRKIQFELFPIINDQVHSCLGLLKNKPQINADERRFVNLNIQHFSEVYSENGLTESPQSTQRAQSLPTPVAAYEKAAASRFRTQMTRIARIFTDTCASSSKQSVFSRIYSLIDEDTNPQISQIRTDLTTGRQT